MDTPVRAVINRAASLLYTPLSLLALVVDPRRASPACTAAIAAGHLARGGHALGPAARVWVDKPYERVLAVMPAMYDDLWTAAKGMYKIEPAVADGGEVVIYAPHVTEVSYVHGKLLDEVGYHCRDYFLAQWERFKHYPGGILAHSTHVRGLGTFDAVVRPRNAAHPRHARHRHPARALRADQSRLSRSGDRQSGRLAGAPGWLRRPARGRDALPGRSAADVGGRDHVLRATVLGATCSTCNVLRAACSCHVLNVPRAETCEVRARGTSMPHAARSTSSTALATVARSTLDVARDRPGAV